MKTVLSAIVLVAVSSLSVAAITTAKVEQGLLNGTHEGELTVYKGVPFAAPPVGDLALAPSASWTRRQVWHLGALGTAVRDRIWRLVCAQYVYPGK